MTDEDAAEKAAELLAPVTRGVGGPKYSDVKKLAADIQAIWHDGYDRGRGATKAEGPYR